MHHFVSFFNDYSLTGIQGSKTTATATNASAILEFSNSNNFQNKNIKLIGVPDHFIEHGTIQELHQIAGIDKESIKNEIEKLL
jgi:1-deoxy-D-xylulose-5-phosphate synthase